MTFDGQPRTGAAVLAIMVALVGAAAGLLACTRPASPTVAASAAAVTVQPPSADPAVDLGGPGAVCDAFAAAMFTIDTATDTGPSDAYRRAAAYATGQLATALVAATARRSPDWAQLVAHHGRVTAEVAAYAGEPPPDHGASAHRATVVTTATTGRTGWSRPPGRHIVYCTLSQAGPRWQIAAYEVERRQLP
jgi:hypothetical protein